MKRGFPLIGCDAQNYLGPTLVVRTGRRVIVTYENRSLSKSAWLIGPKSPPELDRRILQQVPLNESAVR